jgi:hypothetical protein
MLDKAIVVEDKATCSTTVAELEFDIGIVLHICAGGLIYNAELNLI